MSPRSVPAGAALLLCCASLVTLAAGRPWSVREAAAGRPWSEREAAAGPGEPRERHSSTLPDLTSLRGAGAGAAGGRTSRGSAAFLDGLVRSLEQLMTPGAACSGITAAGADRTDTLRPEVSPQRTEECQREVRRVERVRGAARLALHTSEQLRSGALEPARERQLVAALAGLLHALAAAVDLAPAAGPPPARVPAPERPTRAPPAPVRPPHFMNASEERVALLIRCLDDRSSDEPAYTRCPTIGAPATEERPQDSESGGDTEAKEQGVGAARRRRKRDLISAITPVSPIASFVASPLVNVATAPVEPLAKPAATALAPAAKPLAEPLGAAASSPLTKPLQTVSGATSKPVKEALSAGKAAGNTTGPLRPVGQAVAGASDNLASSSDTATLGSGTATGNMAQGLDQVVEETVKTARRYADTSTAIEDPYQDISALSKSKYGRNIQSDPAGAAETRLSLQKIMANPSLQQTQRFGSNYQGLDVFISGGLRILSDV